MQIAFRHTDKTPPTEAELAEGCRLGNARMQRELYDRYRRTMYGVCLRYTDNRDDAMDVLQEGFIRVFRNISSFRGEGSLEGWVRRVMISVSLEHYRRKSRYFFVDIEDAGDMAQGDVNAIARMGADELTALIQQLPVGYRTVFNLFAVEGYSHEEIGQMLGISEGTSKSQFARARKVLQDKVRDLHREQPRDSRDTSRFFATN